MNPLVEMLEEAIVEEGEALDREIDLHAKAAGRALDAQDRVQVLESVLDDIWREIVAYPAPQVCKHLIASNILSRMETLGFEIPKALAKAVVEADDETALAHARLTKAEPT